MRRVWMDNLRWSTVLLVLIYHVCYLFNGVGILGGIPGAPNLSVGDWFAAAVYPWFMMLLFLVAGMSSRFALEKRTVKEFLRERTVKLLVPSTLGLLVVHWITGYLNIKMGGGLEYIPPFLIYPIAALSGTGPLWFAQMLWLFSFIPALMKKLDKKDVLVTWCGKSPVWVWIPAGFLLLWTASQVGNLPVLTMYRFGIYLLAFLLGYLVFSQDRMTEDLRKAAVPLACLALAAGVGYLRHYGGTDYTAPACLQSYLANLYAWLAALALLALFCRCFDRTNALCTYLTKASFGLYVLHYPAFMCVGYLLITYFAFPAPVNYLVLLTSGTALAFAAYELLRRIPVIRFLVLGQGKRDTAISKP